jgi:hypothetical protein
VLFATCYLRFIGNELSCAFLNRFHRFFFDRGS